jgi:hypothetical protein
MDCRAKKGVPLSSDHHTKLNKDFLFQKELHVQTVLVYLVHSLRELHGPDLAARDDLN